MFAFMRWTIGLTIVCLLFAYFESNEFRQAIWELVLPSQRYATSRYASRYNFPPPGSDIPASSAHSPAVSLSQFVKV